MKKLIVLSSLVLSTSVFLTACGGSDYTVDYLYENDDVRAKVLADCKSNKESDSNCGNANQAEQMKKSKENTDKYFQ